MRNRNGYNWQNGKEVWYMLSYQKDTKNVIPMLEQAQDDNLLCY